MNRDSLVQLATDDADIFFAVVAILSEVCDEVQT